MFQRSSIETTCLVLLYLSLLFVPVNAVPAILNSRTAVFDPAHIIPSSFITTLLSQSGKLLYPFNTFLSSLFGATGYALREYDATTSGCGFGCGGDGIKVIPTEGRESLFQTKFAVWGLYSCSRKIRDAARPGAQRLDPRICLLQSGVGHVAGRIEYTGSDNSLESLENASSPVTNPNIIVSRALPEQESSESDIRPDNGTQGSTPNPIGNRCVAASQCQAQFMQNQWVLSRITQITTTAIMPENIIFAFMEAILELAARNPRYNVMPLDWTFAYTSVTEGVAINLRTVRPFAGGKPQPDYRHVIESFQAMAQAYTHGFSPYVDWPEADFDIVVNQVVVAKAEIRKG